MTSENILIDQSVEHRQQWLDTRTRLEHARFSRLSAAAIEKGRMSMIDYFLPGATWGLKMARLHQRGKANAQDIRVVEHELSFEQLPETFDGYRLLHLTDLHIDSLPGIEDAISECIAPLRYDACVLTGDYRFHAYGDYKANVRLPLAQIMSNIYAPDGVYATLGNHDTHPAVNLLDGLGARVLANENVVIARGTDRITLTGIDDPHYYFTNQAVTTLQRPVEGFKVALVHSPELYQEAAAAGYHLYLCGHTHGGQICLPTGTPVLRNLNKGHHLVQGLWQEQQMTGYTSPGCGVSGIPVRFFSRGEITLFTLRKKK